MALTAFNIGKDMAMSIHLNGILDPAPPSDNPFLNLVSAVGSFLFGPNPDGIGPADLGLLLDFDVKQDWDVTKRRPCNKRGVTDFKKHFKGWEGYFDIVRQNSSGDYLAQLFQDAYLSGKGELLGTIIQVKISPVGSGRSKTTWLYQDSIIVPVGNGRYHDAESVVQRFEFFCPQRSPGGHTGEVTNLEAALISQANAMQYASGF